MPESITFVCLGRSAGTAGAIGRSIRGGLITTKLSPISRTSPTTTTDCACSGRSSAERLLPRRAAHGARSSTDSRQLARGREHKIFAFEIANEAGSNGFDGRKGIAELRSLGARLSRKTAVLVALSDPAIRR